MTYSSDVAFTKAVKEVQAERGSRRSYARMELARGGFETRITEHLAAFIAQRNSAYLATANAAGQPYVQHRGGPPGFIRVLGARTLGFADFVGNKQYITTGNLLENDRAFLFFMDYAHRQRMKIWGSARVVRGDRALLDRLTDATYEARVEQAILFDVFAWDANCPQHIPQLVPTEEAAAVIERLRTRVEVLEAQLRAVGKDFDP